MAIINLVGCSCSIKISDATKFYFTDDQKEGEVLSGSNLIIFIGDCRATTEANPTAISESCQLLNLKYKFEDYDTNKIDVQVNITSKEGKQPKYPYQIEIELRHKDSAFPIGDFFFDFYLVWYEKDNPEQQFYQTITNFHFYSVQ